MNSLPYGEKACLRLEAPPHVRITRCGAPLGEAVADVAGAVTGAIAEPLDYPPLARSVVPGDRVTIAVAEGVPHAADAVESIAGTLVSAGVSACDLTVLCASAGSGGESGVAALAASCSDARRLVHDPADRRQMAFLARTSDQMPVLLNRALIDADVVVSVGCLRPTRTLGYSGAAGALCPSFSDEPTQRRYRAFHATETPRQHAERAREKAAEIAWLLGARFTVQIVPGRGNDVLEVIAGELAAVASAGQRACDEMWSQDDVEPASLVVAAIEGGPQQQTWDNVGLALAAAGEVAEPGGAIALCTELSTPPGEALQTLAGADSLPEAVQAIRKSMPRDALAALHIARALTEHHVYLLSRLASRDVEELGMVAVSHPDELSHLARSRPSCLLLSGGQNVQVRQRRSAECGMRNGE